MVKVPDTKKYVGFYLVEGMWAGAKPDYSKFNDGYWLTPEYTKLMEEIVVSLKDDDREVFIARDGLIAYRDKELDKAVEPGKDFPRIETYAEILNALFLVMVSVITEDSQIKYHTYFEISHHDFVPVTYEGSDWKGAGVPTKSMASQYLNKRFLSYIPHNMTNSLDIYLDSPPRPVVSEDTLKKAVELFFGVVTDKRSARLFGRTNKALAEYASTAFSDTILITWLQIETYLYDLLKGYMRKEGSSRFNADRRKRLSKESTVSEAIEILEVAGQLDTDLYKRLCEVRRIRNKIVHEDYSADHGEAAKAVELTQMILRIKSGKAIALYTGLSWSGF